jgi:hypothetical protein
MKIDPENPAFSWCSGPLASTCIAFVSVWGQPFLVPRETLRIEIAKAALNGEKVPTFKEFMLRLHAVDGPVRRK